MQGLDSGVRYLENRRFVIIEFHFPDHSPTPTSAPSTAATDNEQGYLCHHRKMCCRKSVVSANSALASTVGKVCFTMVLSMASLHIISRLGITALIDVLYRGQKSREGEICILVSPPEW